MATLTHRTGDATVITHEPVIVAHVVNDRGGWGAGFTGAVSRRWTKPEQEYRAWAKEALGVPFRRGMIQVVSTERGVWVANLLAQEGYASKRTPTPLDYDALDTCLRKLADAAREREAFVQMPRIGAGLAGGDWERIEAMIRNRLVDAGIDVHVVTLP